MGGGAGAAPARELEDDIRRTLPEQGDWDDLRARFEWHVPKRFSIADACCDDWARRDPQRVALVHLQDSGKSDQWTFAALKDASDRFANALLEMGVGRGDVVAVLLPQCPEVMITHFAAMKIGAVVLPLFTLFGPDALAFRLRDSRARICVCDTPGAEVVSELARDLPDLSHVIVTGAQFAGFLARARPTRPRVATQADDPAVLIYTSGTTGPPKGALHAHRFLIGHLPSVELQHEFFPRPGDVGWTPADWAWIGGLMDLAMPCLHFGVPVISHRMRKFDPDAAFRLIGQREVKCLFLPPTALKLMRQATVPASVDIRSVGSGGESLGADLHEWGREKLRAPINEIYGQTECNLVISTCHGAMPLRPGTMGRAVPGHTVAIMRPDGTFADPGETGEICIKAPDPVMFLGYLNRPDATEAKFRDGWLKTGDLGRMDADGYFVFDSRDDDVMTSAGYRIGPTEIENCLLGDDDVVMAAVVGLPDPVRTEVVTAFVVLRSGAGRAGLADRLMNRVRERVSPHAAPRDVRFVPSLPMTATGKILRRSLREDPPAGEDLRTS